MDLRRLLRPAAMAAAGLLLVGLGLLLGRLTAPSGNAPEPAPLSVPAPAPLTPGEPGRTVRLFFADPETTALREVSRQVPQGVTPVEEAKRLLDELIRGPGDALAPTIPEGTRVRQLYIDGEGTAYVDFTRELQANHAGGTAGELLTIYSIVDTLASNLEQVKRVQLLVEGAEITTLAGHIDARRPFTPRYTFESAR
ncbi:MAG: GerMN domain-containing protein [candidate division NC10 bacterium]